MVSIKKIRYTIITPDIDTKSGGVIPGEQLLSILTSASPRESKVTIN